MSVFVRQGKPCNSDMVKVKAQGREIRIGRILICVRVIIVLVAGNNPVTVEW